MKRSAVGGSRIAGDEERAASDHSSPANHEPRTANRFWRRLLVGVVAIVVLVGVMLAAFGYIVTRVPEYRVQVQDWINSRSGLVVEFREPAFYDKGPGSIIVSFDAGAPVTAEVPGNIGEHSLDVGDTVPIEYDPASPEPARVTWTREQLREDLAFAKGWVAVTGALAGFSALGWLAGARRGRQTS